MNISVISVGKLKEKYLKDGILEYSKRLSRFCSFEIIELNDEKILNGKLLLESHYFIKRDGSVIRVRDEDMETELDKIIFNKYVFNKKNK